MAGHLSTGGALDDYGHDVQDRIDAGHFDRHDTTVDAEAGLPEAIDQHTREARTALDDLPAHIMEFAFEIARQEAAKLDVSGSMETPLDVNAYNIELIMKLLVFFTLQNEVELCRELARKIQEYWDKS